jgi:hypothetical protein
MNQKEDDEQARLRNNLMERYGKDYTHKAEGKLL